MERKEEWLKEGKKERKLVLFAVVLSHQLECDRVLTLGPSHLYI